MGLLDDAIREHLELKRQRGASDEELQRAEQDALGPARREPAAEPEGLGPPAIEEVPGEPVAPPPEPPPPPPPEPLAEPEPIAEVTELHPEPPVDQPTAIRSTLPDADELPEPALPDGDHEDYLALEPAVEAEPPGTTKPHGDPVVGHHEDFVVAHDEPTEDPDAEPHGDPVVESDFDPDEVPVEEQLSGGAPDPDRVRTTILDDPLEEMGPPPAEEPPPAGEQDVLEETPDFLQETPEHDKLWFEQKPPRDFDFD